MSIVLGFDFGMKHIGVAVGQSLTKSATPLGTIAAQDGIPDWKEVEQYILEWRPQEIVVGIPLNMDGTEQPMTQAAKRFAKRLEERFPLPVRPVDERLSSWEAKTRLQENAANPKTKGKLQTQKSLQKGMQKKSKLHKKYLVDLNASAAAILVEQWLREKQ